MSKQQAANFESGGSFVSLEDRMVQERLGRGEEGREEGLGGGEGKARPAAGLAGGEGRGGHGFPHSQGG